MQDKYAMYLHKTQFCVNDLQRERGGNYDATRIHRMI